MTGFVIQQMIGIFAVTTVYYFIKEFIKMKRTKKTGSSAASRDWV